MRKTTVHCKNITESPNNTSDWVYTLREDRNADRNKRKVPVLLGRWTWTTNFSLNSANRNLRVRGDVSSIALLENGRSLPNYDARSRSKTIVDNRKKSFSILTAATTEEFSSVGAQTRKEETHFQLNSTVSSAAPQAFSLIPGKSLPSNRWPRPPTWRICRHSSG